MCFPFSSAASASLIALILLSLSLCVVESQPPSQKANEARPGIQLDGSCQILTMLPFSDKRPNPPDVLQVEGKSYYGFGSWPTPESLGEATYSWMAAVQMAVDHFNARDSSVVPELSSPEYQSCDITLPPPIFVDSAYDKATAVNEALSAAPPSPSHPPLCAVAGPLAPLASEGVAVLTENLNIPQVGYGDINKRTGRTDEFPSVVRTIAEARHLAESVAQWIQRPGKSRDFIAIIYDQTDFGEQFEDPLEDKEDDLGFKSLTEHLVQDDVESIADALGVVVEDGYHTVVLITEQPTFLSRVAEVAEDLGIVGEDWFWILGGASLPPAYVPELREAVDTPLDRMLRGAALFRTLDPFAYADEDGFLRAWRSQGDELVDQLNAMHPFAGREGTPELFMGGGGYFQEMDPSALSSFVYDSVMLVGMSACKLRQQSASSQNVFEVEGMKRAHVKMMLRTEFNGASGHVKFIEGENSRDPEGVTFGIYNIRPGSVDGSGERGYDSILTSVNHGEGWEDVDDSVFLFFDGTTDQPMPLQTVTDENFLSRGIHIFGLTLMSLAIFISVASGVWVFVMRNEKAVKAAQPEFLFLLCVGASTMAVSLSLISFDESYGWSENKLGKACVAFPWLFVMGYLVMYCAIFSKLWRINKIFSARRMKVTIHQVLWPFAIFIAASTVVLIVWTVMDPYRWYRTITSEEPLVTYGRCDSPTVGTTPFVATLGVLLGIITVMTMAIAWKARDIQDEFSETKWIFYGIFSNLQTWLIGIPLIILLDTVSTDAAYLIRAFVIFIFSVSLVTMVIWPKTFAWCQGKLPVDADTAQSNSYNPRPVINMSGRNEVRISGVGSIVGFSTQKSNSNVSSRSKITFGAADADSTEAEKERVELLQKRVADVERQLKKQKTALLEKDELLRQKEEELLETRKSKKQVGKSSVVSDTFIDELESIEQAR